MHPYALGPYPALFIQDISEGHARNIRDWMLKGNLKMALRLLGQYAGDGVKISQNRVVAKMKDLKIDLENQYMIAWKPYKNARKRWTPTDTFLPA